MISFKVLTLLIILVTKVIEEKQRKSFFTAFYFLLDI